MGIGNPHQFEQTLDGAVFAETAMQGIEGRIGFCFKQLIAGIVAGVHHDGIETFVGQRLHHPAPGGQGDFAFGRAPAHQHSDPVVAHGAPSFIGRPLPLDFPFELDARIWP